MADIFLSYAREDEARAHALAAALESRGWSIFWDRRIPHGRNFRKHIEDQLGSARCIVVLWSKASLASQFVLDEATEGLNDGRLVPALIEAVRQPLGFRGLQAASLADWTGAETSHDEFERLVSSIGEIVPPFVQGVPSTSVVEVAASTRADVEPNTKPAPRGTDVRAADIPSVDRGPQPALPPATVTGPASGGAMDVVVINEDAKHPLEMVLIQNQEPVEAFRTDGPHEPSAPNVWTGSWSSMASISSACFASSSTITTDIGLIGPCA